LFTKVDKTVAIYREWIETNSVQSTTLALYATSILK